MQNEKITIISDLHFEWVRLVNKFGEITYAEDIVQETYIKILTTGAINKAIENGKANRAFMYKALRNNVISYYRSKGKVYKVELSDTIAYEDIDENKHIALEIVESEIENEINSWHWYDRDMFLHYMNSNKSQRDIAKGSKISLSSISNTIVACKNRIRERVGEDIDDIYNKEFDLVIMAKKKRGKVKGLGDIVEKMTKATGIKKVVEFIAGEDCGCDERRDKLNSLFPIGSKPECLNENDYNWCKAWFNNSRSTMRHTEQVEFLAIYNRVFNTNYNVSNCGPCVLSKLGELEKVYREYESDNKL